MDLLGASLYRAKNFNTYQKLQKLDVKNQFYMSRVTL